MSKIDHAMHQLHSLESMAKEERWINRLHPSVKLFLTILYVVLTVSFSKYQLAGLLGMVIYPAALFIVAELSLKDALWRLRIVLPLVCIVGAANPFLDRTAAMNLGGIVVSGGVLSMLSLMLKGVLAVLASYLLIATTSIEKICYALRQAHVPKILVTEILLIYRYITVLLSETRRVVTAYSLRAPKQKGIAFAAWGPLAGQMLLRSMDRAERVYQSMCLRGFRGEFCFGGTGAPGRTDVLWLVFWTAMLLVLRFVPVMEIVGGLFV
ncbi:MAG: cobalt ECF transporter T component CbiQ [Blautia sp.]|nr:cobalt ECF transporter T component CbiQ [Blautia sp.]